MRAGDTTHRIVTVLNADDTPATGLTIADFTVTARGRGYGASVWSTYTHSSAIVELGSGDYALSFLAPAAAGWWRYKIAPNVATRTVWNQSFEGEIETQDLDSMFTGLSSVALGASRNIYLGNVWPSAELIAYRYNQWSIPVVDQNRDPIDLSGWTNLALSVRTLDQTTKKLDATNGSPTGFVLTGSAGGIVTVEWPESLGTPGSAADIYSIVPAGSLTMSQALYFEVTGDVDADTDKTVPIIRSSPLIIGRREVGS
jgi:hypothetical protein